MNYRACFTVLRLVFFLYPTCTTHSGRPCQIPKHPELLGSWNPVKLNVNAFIVPGKLHSCLLLSRVEGKRKGLDACTFIKPFFQLLSKLSETVICDKTCLSLSLPLGGFPAGICWPRYGLLQPLLHWWWLKDCITATSSARISWYKGPVGFHLVLLFCPWSLRVYPDGALTPQHLPDGRATKCF